MTKTTGRIQLEGTGGFLNPPTHPEHSASVWYDRDCSCSLSHAVDCEWLDDAIRAECRRKLAEWDANKPPLDSPEVQEWVLQVLGYFRNCYRGDGPEPECWHVGNLRIARVGTLLNPVDNTPDNHAGVHFIRKFYPDFTPDPTHFAESYWGQKPQPEKE